MRSRTATTKCTSRAARLCPRTRSRSVITQHVDGRLRPHANTTATWTAALPVLETATNASQWQATIQQTSSSGLSRGSIAPHTPPAEDMRRHAQLLDLHPRQQASRDALHRRAPRCNVATRVPGLLAKRLTPS